VPTGIATREQFFLPIVEEPRNRRFDRLKNRAPCTIAGALLKLRFIADPRYGFTVEDVAKPLQQAISLLERELNTRDKGRES